MHKYKLFQNAATSKWLKTGVMHEYKLFQNAATFKWIQTGEMHEYKLFQNAATSKWLQTGEMHEYKLFQNAATSKWLQTGEMHEYKLFQNATTSKWLQTGEMHEYKLFQNAATSKWLQTGEIQGEYKLFHTWPCDLYINSLLQLLCHHNCWTVFLCLTKTTCTSLHCLVLFTTQHYQPITTYHHLSHLNFYSPLKCVGCPLTNNTTSCLQETITITYCTIRIRKLLSLLISLSLLYGTVVQADIKCECQDASV